MTMMTMRSCVKRVAPSALPMIHGTSKQPIRFHSSSNKPRSEPSIFSSAAEYYNNLRWRFATSLTDSLSKEKQQELLGRLTVHAPRNDEKTATSTSSSNDHEETTKQSIAEAVAAARAEESRRLSDKWEKEKAKLLQEAEKAARERVENELVIQQRRVAFEKWQQEVERDKEARTAATDHPLVNATTVTVDDSSITATKVVDAQSPVFDDHPVLGAAIVDLGYKRVHIASVHVLKTLPVWKKQRTYRHERAQTMAKDKMKTLNIGLPGIIALHEDSMGALSIIDGQHRVAMLTILAEKGSNAGNNMSLFDLDRILVEVFPEDKANLDESSSSSHAEEIFLEINKAEPVKLVDLPGIGLSKSDRNTINEGASRIEAAFPAMFSASQRCRAPHLNIDNLRDALFASDVVKRHALKSPKALETWMLERNESIKQEYTSEASTKAGTVSKAALDKAVKNGFFLGLDSSWLYT